MDPGSQHGVNICGSISPHSLSIRGLNMPPWSSKHYALSPRIKSHGCSYSGHFLRKAQQGAKATQACQQHSGSDCSSRCRQGMAEGDGEGGHVGGKRCSCRSPGGPSAAASLPRRTQGTVLTSLTPQAGGKHILSSIKHTPPLGEPPPPSQFLVGKPFMCISIAMLYALSRMQVGFLTPMQVNRLS